MKFTINIFPDQPLYYEVIVFDNTAELCEYIGIKPDSYIIAGYLTKEFQNPPKMGEILFCRDYSFFGTVIHESVHAAQHVCSEIEWYFSSDRNGEFIAYLSDYLTTQIIDKAGPSLKQFEPVQEARYHLLHGLSSYQLAGAIRYQIEKYLNPPPAPKSPPQKLIDFVKNLLYKPAVSQQSAQKV